MVYHSSFFIIHHYLSYIIIYHPTLFITPHYASSLITYHPLDPVFDQCLGPTYLEVIIIGTFGACMLSAHEKIANSTFRRNSVDDRSLNFFRGIRITVFCSFDSLSSQECSHIHRASSHFYFNICIVSAMDS